MKTSRRRAGGFTLIEVVGAVAIVGIVFLILSTATFSGIAAEGTAHRRLEASLVADDALAEVELQMLMSLPIEIDATEFGDLDGDGLTEYAVIGEMSPYDPTTEIRAGSNGALSGNSRTSNTTSQTEMQRVRIDVFLANEFGEAEDGDLPLASRTAFILDTETINTLAPSRGAGAPTEEGDQGEGEADEGSSAADLEARP